MTKIRSLLLAAALFGASVVPAFAGAAENGTAAFKRGDYAGAIAAWRPIAGRDANVQNIMGIMYMKGIGVRQNQTEALRWFVRAASSGSSLAQNNLGGLYRDGLGVPRDYSKSAAFFQSAASNGLAAAQLNLGLLYQSGQGVRADATKAFIWYSMAAAQNAPHALANRNLLATRMNSRDVAMAQIAATRCAQSRYKSCG